MGWVNLHPIIQLFTINQFTKSDADKSERLAQVQKVGGECGKKFILATYDTDAIHQLISDSVKFFILVNFWTGSRFFTSLKLQHEIEESNNQKISTTEDISKELLK